MWMSRILNSNWKIKDSGRLSQLCTQLEQLQRDETIFIKHLQEMSCIIIIIIIFIIIIIIIIIRQWRYEILILVYILNKVKDLRSLEDPNTYMHECKLISFENKA